MEQREFIVEQETAGQRIDRFLSGEDTGLSRSALQALVAEGHVQCNGKTVAKSLKLKAGDTVLLEIPDAKPIEAVPQDIPLEIVYEDSHLLVVNKPKGMVVHPAPGNPDGTLVNALLWHCKGSLSGIGGEIRPGIVHRIDKDTSGLLVVAKTDAAHEGLCAQIMHLGPYDDEPATVEAMHAHMEAQGYALDITDEVIQNYYKYVLDSTKPAKPGKIDVKASQVQDADNNVYGRYKVTWDEPKDEEASPAAYYRVEILPCNAEGTVAAGAVPYLKADVYQRSYTFVADKAWTGNFVVRVTPYNTNNDSTQVDNSRTSAVQTFMHALPTPEIEFRLVKRTGGGFDWGQCQTPDEKSREFKYEVVAVLKNYTEYPTDEAWTVKLTDGKHTYYFSRQDGKQYIRLTQNLERTLTLTALATPDNSSSTKYLRSAQYKSETYLPSQWRDHNGGSGKDEDGLPLGTLKQDGDTDYVTYTGQTAESFEATVKFSFTPKVKSDSSEHGSPTYRVMLLAKYLGDDTVNGQSLYGQYITLAAREGIVTETPVTFNLNSLPSDAMSNYTDFLVIAVPITSGKGDVTTRWDATPDEVSAAIASHANDTSKEIWWKNGYEIVRTGEHSYTYAHLTPLCFSDVNRTDDQGWAIQATQTTPQIIFKQLNLNVLKAPTLAETIEDGVVDDNNQLTYTFKWTQDDMQATDAAPDYQIKLYGHGRQCDRSGANCAEGRRHPDADTKWQKLYTACQRGYYAGQRQRQLAL